MWEVLGTRWKSSDFSIKGIKIVCLIVKLLPRSLSLVVTKNCFISYGCLMHSDYTFLSVLIFLVSSDEMWLMFILIRALAGHICLIFAIFERWEDALDGKTP